MAFSGLWRRLDALSLSLTATQIEIEIEIPKSSIPIEHIPFTHMPHRECESNFKYLDKARTKAQRSKSTDMPKETEPKRTSRRSGEKWRRGKEAEVKHFRLATGLDVSTYFKFCACKGSSSKGQGAKGGVGGEAGERGGSCLGTSCEGRTCFCGIEWKCELSCCCVALYPALDWVAGTARRWLTRQKGYTILD